MPVAQKEDAANLWLDGCFFNWIFTVPQSIPDIQPSSSI